ncbi:hypothetical protein Q1695_013909 [Nippostrongylus brasiliensis]|nr:hypothetical protein Q1695_013909 [Nippostrongylus brasiliensis]
MSAGLAINRPSTGSLAFEPHSSSSSPSSSSGECHSTVNRCNQQTQTTQQQLCECDLELRLREAIRQRDDQWRRHEREQIVFLQNETAAMLRGLHKEIERLGYQLKDAKRQLYVPDDSPCDHSEMEAKIEQQQEHIRQLEQEVREKEQRASNVDKAAELVEKLKEQINIQADRIRQLTSELNERNQTVAHLTSQLRSYRLRDAMATAQQRRRASSTTNCSSPSPITSPSSPHRIFPPKGLVSASVTVSYPGSRSSAGERSGSVDRIMRRKSASTVSMNKMN